MPRGLRFKLLRKASAFLAGELGTGELGVNTAAKQLAFSTDGVDVNIVGVGSVSPYLGMLASVPPGLPSGTLFDQAVSSPSYSASPTSASRVYAVPVVLAFTQRISELSIYLSAAPSASVDFALGIAETEPEGYYPAKVVAATPVIASGTATGVKGGELDFTLQAGKLYYYLLATSGALNSVSALSTGAAHLGLTAGGNTTNKLLLAIRTFAAFNVGEVLGSNLTLSATNPFSIRAKVY